MGLIIPSILQLAKSFSDTHFANASDTGEDIPGCENICLWLPSLFYYLLHSMARAFSFSVLFLHFPHYAYIMFIPQTLINIAIERYISGQKAIINNIRDALAALVAPICNLYDDTEARQFYRWNCITFAINLSITSLVLNLFSAYDIIDIRKPRLLYEFGLEPIPEEIMGWGSLLIIILTVLISGQSGIFAYWRCSYVHEMQKPLDQGLKNAGDWMKAKAKWRDNNKTTEDIPSGWLATLK